MTQHLMFKSTIRSLWLKTHIQAASFKEESIYVIRTHKV